MTFSETLKAMDACLPAIQWVGDKTIEQAWMECERGDWMLWLADKLNIDQKLLVSVACDCAEPALKYITEGELRPAIAIETARAWCDVRATLEQVITSYIAADDAAYAYAEADAEAAAYAASAAVAAGNAAAASHSVCIAATAAADAADAATYETCITGYATWNNATRAAATAVADTAAAASNKHSAEIVRKRIPIELIIGAFDE